MFLTQGKEAASEPGREKLKVVWAQKSFHRFSAEQTPLNKTRSFSPG